MTKFQYIHWLVVPHKSGKTSEGFNVAIGVNRFFNKKYYGSKIGAERAARLFRDKVANALKEGGIVLQHGHIKRKPKK